MPRFIALLRGINVGGKNRIPMKELCALCGRLGWTGVRHYIQSGNVAFTAPAPAPAPGYGGEHETALERAVTKRFKLSVPVIVRSAAQWGAYVESNPFAQASAAEPNRVLLVLSKSPPAKDAAAALCERARDGEGIKATAGAIWIHFPSGQARSKLTPALLDRLIGSTATMRNWTTVLRIRELLAEK